MPSALNQVTAADDPWQSALGSTIWLRAVSSGQFMVRYNLDRDRWAVLYKPSDAGFYTWRILDSHAKAWAKTAKQGMAMADMLAAAGEQNEAMAAQLVAQLLG